MKNTFASLLVLSACLLLLVGCNDPQKTSPRATADVFLAELQQGNYESAKVYCTPESADKLDLFESFSSMGANPFSETYTILREEADGNYARVFYTQGDGPEKMIRLRNTTGKWEVMATKNDLAAGDNDAEMDIDLGEDELKEIGKGIGEVAKGVGEGLKKGMEEFGEEMQDLSEDMEDSFELRETPGHKYREYREDKTPEEIAAAFLTALSYNDEKGAKRYASKQTANLLSMNLSNGSKYDDFELQRTQLDGEYAKVFYTLPATEDEERVLKMRKDSYGNWEVLMTKDDQPKEKRRNRK